MSTVLSDDTKEVVINKVRTLEAIICDRCGKRLEAINRRHKCIDQPHVYFDITFNRYGSDYEDMEHLDLCVECCAIFASAFAKDTSCHRAYLEMERKPVIRHDVFTEDVGHHLSED